MSNRSGSVVGGGKLAQLTNVIVDDADEGQLLAAVRGGDSEAYGALYEMHSDSVQRLARQLCRDRHEADDVVSEVFVNTLRAINHGAGPDAECRAYLLRSVRHTVQKVRTRKDTGRAAPTATEELDRIGVAGEPLSELDFGPATEAWAGVSERFRKVLWSVEVDGFDTNDIAVAEQIAPPAAASLVYRARRALRRSFVRGAVRAPIAGADCASIRALLPVHLDHESSAASARRIDEHLASCSPCETALEEMRAAHTKLAGRGWLVLVPAFLRGVATDVLHGAAAIGTPVAAAATIGAATLVFTAEPAAFQDAATTISMSAPSPVDASALLPAAPQVGGSAAPSPAASTGDVTTVPQAPGVLPPGAIEPANPVTPGDSAAAPEADAAAPIASNTTAESASTPAEAAAPAETPRGAPIVEDILVPTLGVVDEILTPTVAVADGIVTPTLGAVGDLTAGIPDTVAGKDGVLNTLAGDIPVVADTTEQVHQGLGDLLGAVDQTLGGAWVGAKGLLGGLAPR